MLTCWQNHISSRKESQPNRNPDQVQLTAEFKANRANWKEGEEVRKSGEGDAVTAWFDNYVNKCTFSVKCGMHRKLALCTELNLIELKFSLLFKIVKKEFLRKPTNYIHSLSCSMLTLSIQAVTEKRKNSTRINLQQNQNQNQNWAQSQWPSGTTD